MSVDKFGRHQSAVRARRETRRSLREDIGITMTEDGHFDVAGKKIHNLGEPRDDSDAVPLRFVRDNCLLAGDPSTAAQGIDAKGRKLVNVGAPVDLADAVNKQYVDYSCLRFTQLVPNKKNGAVVDARDHRIQSLREPIRARDAATKIYVDSKIIPKDTNSNLMVGNVRITQLAPPMNNKDAVNLEFLNRHTITAVNDAYFNAQGKTILNVGDGGARATDAVNARQLEDVKRYAKSETYKLAKVFQHRWEKVVSYIYKLHTRAARTSLGAEEADLLLMNKTETNVLISDLDKSNDEQDWRSLYREQTKQ